MLGTHFPQNPPHLPYILVPSWELDKEKSQSRKAIEITVAQKASQGLHTTDLLTNYT